MLNTAGARRRRNFPWGFRLEWLKAISDPNIAYLLMTIGTIGIIAELYSPGAILPGIVGAISLILAFYSFQSLPVNYAGMLLFLLGIVFFVLEASVTSYGLLAIGGVIVDAHRIGHADQERCRVLPDFMVGHSAGRRRWPPPSHCLWSAWV